MIAQLQSLLSMLATTFDLPVLDFIRANLTSPLMDKIMTIITYGGEAPTVIAFAFILVLFRKTRKTGWSVTAAMLLGLVLCNIILKPMVARIRPYDLHAELTGEIIPLLIKTPHDFSFPSGHTIAVFEVCTALMLRNKFVGVLAVLLACAVAFSRMYLYVHYPSDVIFSLVFGIIFGMLGTLIVNIIYNHLPEKKSKGTGGKFLAAK